jgi:hypothetical protein
VDFAPGNDDQNEVSMHAQSSPGYLKLTTVPGVVAESSSSLPDVACPFCANTDVAFLMGKVSFSATISGDDLLGGAQPLAAVICSKSHVFFLREQDTVQANDAAA